MASRRVATDTRCPLNQIKNGCQHRCSLGHNLLTRLLSRALTGVKMWKKGGVENSL